jgi:HD-like signal output (HDOD) protein
VAGLLHDIGKIVQMTLVPSAFAEIVRRAEQQKSIGLEDEEAVMGFNHAEAGRLLAERWNLPAQLLAAIGGHHGPAAGGGEPAGADIVHVADIFSRALGLGGGLTGQVPPLDKNAWQRLRLRPGAVDEVMAEMLDAFDAMRSFLS